MIQRLIRGLIFHPGPNNLICMGDMSTTASGDATTNHCWSIPPSTPTQQPPSSHSETLTTRRFSLSSSQQFYLPPILSASGLRRLGLPFVLHFSSYLVPIA